MVGRNAATVRTDDSTRRRLDALMPGESQERARLRARPDFPWIARQAAINLSDAYRGNVLLTRLLNDRGRFVLSLLIMDMHLEAPDAPGLTTGRLKAEAVALDVCSPGRVGAIVAAFRVFGMIAPTPDADGRRRRLVVTDKLMSIHRERWRTMLNTLALVVPEEGERGLRHLDDPVFLAAFVRTLLEPLRGGWRPSHDIPAIGQFAERDGGLLIALALFGIGLTGQPLSISQLARSFRISRSHVVGIVQEATEAGLVRRVDEQGGRGPGVLPQPALIEAMENFVALALVRQMVAVRAGLAALDRRDAA
ncbi:MarR family transcriptional regulator [Ancylobacter sp. FA202]|uniref:MarR family transcriptional regulator n=1 Tax=Ancylobacter sp. FA202 TaxID=1111106 RepID=UPI00035E6E16|nr:MarR family transcriptional regulator [Ancylobacter sp. FA202]